MFSNFNLHHRLISIPCSGQVAFGADGNSYARHSPRSGKISTTHCAASAFWGVIIKTGHIYFPPSMRQKESVVLSECKK